MMRTSGLRKFLFACAYLFFVAAGIAGLMTGTLLSPLVTPFLVKTYSVFMIIGGLCAAAGVYTKVQWELAGLPFLAGGHGMYAIALITFAVQTGRGWLTTFIVCGVVINIFRRILTAWAYKDDPLRRELELRG